MAENTQNIDLFGNTTLTPRQVIQQQLAKSVSNTEAMYKDANPVNRAAAIWGSGLGGLFRNVLQEKGIIDKDPEVIKAEQSEAFRRDTESKAKEVGLTLDPQDPADWAGKMAAIGLQAIQQVNEDGTPKYPELQDMAPKLMERYIQSQAAQEAARLRKAQITTEEGKPAVQAAAAEKDIAQAAEARDRTKQGKIETKAEFNGEKWQDFDIDKYGNKKAVGKPYDMSEKLKGRGGKGDSDNPTFNTALRAFNGAYDFTENFGLKEKTDLPAYNRGLSLIGKYIEQGIDPLKAGSRAAAESQIEHKIIQSVIREQQKLKKTKPEIIKMLKDAAAEKGITIDAELYFKK